MTAPAPARKLIDVEPWTTEIAGQQVTLLLSGESVARDHQAQIDQAAMLVEFLRASDTK
jgi:hypothetical protein